MKYETEILSRPLSKSWNPVGPLFQVLTAASGYCSVVSTGLLLSPDANGADGSQGCDMEPALYISPTGRVPP